ncbi:hypothetical protein SAMN05216189_1012123 [Pseudomonas delhiensis]|uniref:Uncharacterized protein n=1 Tax=Pseudomonas delhiensis TaxID=366289 RepID=A0A239G3Q6_9PSED|nr:hypothetical protein SAMN05216189_1012123 [Pseudomonas delhiensis]SNS63817.1 hypothetical protein SAMN06295949_104220 [Pseudomonas delhiensis]
MPLPSPSSMPRSLCGLGALALPDGFVGPASAEFLEDGSARLEALYVAHEKSPVAHATGLFRSRQVATPIRTR